MRTIVEVAEDIKSILNNIERTEECTGETLVDINELVDEALSINCYKDKHKTKSDRIRAMSDEELADMLHNIGSYVEKGEPLIDIYIGENKSTIDDNFGFILEWLQSEAE